MNTDIFKNVSKIIERDSKTTTYKFALLRGVIDIIQENSPYITIQNNRAIIPLGLLIEKWLLYYYPLLESPIKIPQINGDMNLAFELELISIINSYKNLGGFSTFYNDLKNNGIPQNLAATFIQLAKKIKETIIRMPMRYIGRSISNKYYSLFRYESRIKIKNHQIINTQFLIENFGYFSMPLDYFEALKTLGNFVGGTDSIFFKWAEFSVNASRKNLSVEKVLNEIFKNPITQREVAESKRIYTEIIQKEGSVFCVWTGKKITKYDIDHLIPFSIWKNNDLWNLFPAQTKINNQKRNKIPSSNTIEKRKELIIYYWELVKEHQPERFNREIKISLLGNNLYTDWKITALNQLKSSCDFLINNRGYEEWNI